MTPRPRFPCKPQRFHMLRVAILALLVLALDCQTSRVQPQSTASQRHLVVLVHGVYGNASHFGEMSAALEAHMGKREPRYRWEVVAFEYDTFSTSAGVDDFAKDLGDFVVRTLGKEPDAGDCFSVVAHSQGGLVTATWAGRAAAGEALFHPWLLEHFDGFMTLATPFWGNKLATWTRAMEPWRRAHEVPDLSPAARQLVDMSLGSPMHARYRRLAIAAHDEGLPPALAHVRPFAMGGYVSWLKAAASVSSGEHEYEDDTAVPLPSSRPDFFYALADNEGYAPGDLVDVSAFSATGFSPWTVVDAIHLSPTVDMPQVSRGIAQVPSACIERLACDHPSFRRVVDHLAGGRVSTATEALPKMTSFLLELEVSLAGAASDDAEVTEVTVVFDDEQPAGVAIDRLLEVYGSGRSPVADGAAVQRLWSYGSAPDSWTGTEHADREVRFTVSAPGYKPRRVHARVRATWSTWVAIRLEPVAQALAPAVAPALSQPSQPVNQPGGKPENQPADEAARGPAEAAAGPKTGEFPAVKSAKEGAAP